MNIWDMWKTAGVTLAAAGSSDKEIPSLSLSQWYSIKMIVHTYIKGNRDREQLNPSHGAPAELPLTLYCIKVLIKRKRKNV